MFESIPDVKKREALALLEVIHWIGDLGQTRVIIELDCKQVVDVIHKPIIDAPEFGVITSIAKDSFIISKLAL